ncbi:MAG: hypothetical protein BVN33_00960 [Proteobacteria bacterium ST_bin13]|mgnify:CR=1 FL=1|nr:MAG: hypothetical protein BVN33_00960 [Proteobacteria bacterium ST_bin13]
MSKGTSDTDWQASARSQLRNQRAAWIGSIAAGAIAGVLMGIGVNIDPGLMRTALLGGGVLAMVVCLVWGTLIYMRVIDEQERDANLWSCYVGMIVYLTLFVAKDIGAKLDLNLPISEFGIFTATMAIVLAVFVKRRFM